MADIEETVHLLVKENAELKETVRRLEKENGEFKEICTIFIMYKRMKAKEEKREEDLLRQLKISHNSYVLKETQLEYETKHSHKLKRELAEVREQNKNLRDIVAENNEELAELAEVREENKNLRDIIAENSEQLAAFGM